MDNIVTYNRRFYFMENKYAKLLKCAVVFVIIILAVLSIMITGVINDKDNEQNNALYAKDRPTLDDVFESTGEYVRNHKNLLKEATKSLKTFKYPDHLVVAQIGDVPLTISELEFRKGLYASVNPAKGTNDIFNELVENKIFINEAVQRGLLPTNAEIDEFLSIHKEKYKSDPEYRDGVDKLIQSWGISEDEYWQEYEWYNAYQIIVMDKVYKDVISEAENKSKLPIIRIGDNNSEVMKKQELQKSYWVQYTMKLKKQADVKVNNKFVNELNFDPNKWYSS